MLALPGRRQPLPSLQSVAMPRLELVECSLRAGQQALLLSRLRSRHAIPVARALDGCGFAALDVFGGSTFEAALRFLGEDPFEQLRAIREAAPSSTLVASLGGQALTGHRQVGDDVVDAFIKVAADAGVDRFRIHDPLNDVRNVRRAMEAARAAGRQVEAAIVYANSPRHDPDRVVALAEQLAAIGADAICIHDPLGLLGVARIGDLVQRVVEATNLPLALSLSTQTGQAEFAAYAAAVAGASRLDVALAPLAGGASVPAAEAVIAALRGTELEPASTSSRSPPRPRSSSTSCCRTTRVFDIPALRIDSAALRGLLPPAAMGHALAELRERNQIDRLDDVEIESRRVRAELGHPPLVTPIIEIVATQAVYNVVRRRPVCDGQPGGQGLLPRPVRVAAIPDRRRGAPARQRPRGADHLPSRRPPRTGAAGAAPRTRARGHRGRGRRRPWSASRCFPRRRWRCAAVRSSRSGSATSHKPRSRCRRAGRRATRARSDEPARRSKRRPPTCVSSPSRSTARATACASSVRAVAVAAAGVGGASRRRDGTVVREGTVVAPMQGLILKVAVKVGDKVELGGVVAVLEAMKMQNDITASRAGTISAVHVKEGDIVGPRDPDRRRSTDVQKVLVANRGEIALRVIRGCRDLGIATVAVHSEADRTAAFVLLADEAVEIGPAPSAQSYLVIDRIIEAARSTGAEAIHPGYGFLSENQQFARACAENGIVFIGPGPEAMAAMGEKVPARQRMREAVCRSCPAATRSRTSSPPWPRPREVGYPVLIKASAGGGGIGMRVARDETELRESLEAAQSTAQRAFGNATVFLERYVDSPRHIEIQVLADTHGNIVHLGERECSIQRRHQKILEEAPSPTIDAATRARMGEAAVTAARAVGYVNAGTVEFIYSNGEFFFLEMNTRLQVEHPVTELVYGVDLVVEQLRVAAGEELQLRQEDLVPRGHAIECRVNARTVREELHAVAGAGHRLPGAQRSGRARRLIAGGAGHGVAELRPARRQADRLGTDARTGHRAHAPGAARVRDHRASAPTSATTSPSSTIPTSSPATTRRTSSRVTPS